MRIVSPQASHVLQNPGKFAWCVLKAFKNNQGLLLAGAVAYYALLSVVPLLILAVIALSHVVDQRELLSTLGRYLEWLVPGQSRAIIGELRNFLDHREVIGWLLLVTMLFFSSLAFTVLENAMSVIFLHRIAIRKRRYVVSAVLPYAYILCLGFGLLVITLASGSLQAMGQESIGIMGHDWSLQGVSGVLLYLLGLAGEIFVLSSVYIVMPVGRLSWRHALLGGGDSGAAVGDHAAPAGLVLQHPVAGQCGLWVADHRHHRAVQPGNRRDAATARRPGHLRIRADRAAEGARAGQPAGNRRSAIAAQLKCTRKWAR